MPRLHVLLLPSMLGLALPCWAEGSLVKAQFTQSRPLNLSLPRDILHTPDSGPADDVVQRNLRAPAASLDSARAPAHLRYGAGYENRHLEKGGAGTGLGTATGGSAGVGLGASAGGRAGAGLGAGAGGGAGASPGAGAGRRGR